MKARKTMLSVLSILLAVTMLPISAIAAGVNIDFDKSCGFYSLISKEDYTLAPGAVESEMVINSADGLNRNVLHVIEVDLSNEDISIMPTYKGLEEGIDLDDISNQGAQQLTMQAAHVENDLGLNVVGGMNTNLRYGNDHPCGVLVWNGHVYSDERNANGVSTAQTFLSVTKDGKASLHSASEPIPEDSYNAISANFGWIIKDGVNQYTKEDHSDSGRAPRSVIGIKENGNLIIMMNDGRLSPYSAGATMHELAEWLLAMGCVDAVNCDGGGSSTFISERAGTGELTMKSVPSDGSERATLGGILVISHAEPDGTFNSAKLTSSEEYITPNGTALITATGADKAGGQAEIPTEAVLQLKDASMGSIENGVFTASDKTGEAVIQMVYEGEVVGETTVNVVIPTAIAFSKAVLTVPYGKTVPVEITATVNEGLNEVTLKSDDIIFTLSDSTLGTLNGSEFTANSGDGVASGSITATFAGTEVTATANLKIGKGSVIVEDFEDGDLSPIVGKPGYSAGEAIALEVVNAETGKVRNGERSMALTIDANNYTYYSGRYYVLLESLGLEDLENATSVGFWIYLPEDAVGLNIDLRGCNAGTADTNRFNVYGIVPIGFTSCHEPGWYYIKADLPSRTTPLRISRLAFYVEDYVDNEDYNYVASEHSNQASKYTLYIDDITVDYSDAVEDREVPMFEDMQFVYGDNDTLVNITGQTINSNTASITVKAYDQEAGNAVGLDMSSAKAYINGYDVTESLTCSSNGLMTLADMTFAEGTHTVRFEICDNNGNPASIARNFTVDATEDEAAVNVVPKDAEADKLLVGSVYWTDVKVQNIENIEKIKTVINLNGMHDWVLNFAEVAEGFEMSYSVDEYTNDATVTITKTGEVTASGEAVIASLPIHTWEVAYDADSSSAHWPKQVVLSTNSGLVTFADSSTQSFSMTPIVVDTEIDTAESFLSAEELLALGAWHGHTAEAIEDLAPTCTKNGYENRTYCEVCESVVDWGTLLPATGHTYELTDGVLKCSCDKTFTGTWTDGKEYVDGVLLADGWVGESYYMDGEKVTGINFVTAPNSEDKFYYDFGTDGVCANKVKYTGLVYDEEAGVYRYSYLGSISTGWKIIGTDYYYFRESTQAAATGTYNYGYAFNKDELIYTFDETGRLIEGAWYETEKGTMYYYGPNYYVLGWQTINGKTYYFEDCCRYEGLRCVITPNSSILQWYDFGEDGAMVEKLTTTGYVENEFGVFYLENGITRLGLFEYEGDYYYARTNGTLATGSYAVSNTNGLLSAGTYEFGADGKMLNGLAESEDGIVRYYVNGVRTYAGLIEIDGDIYYIRSNYQPAVGSYTVSKHNGLRPYGTYTFGADGKLIEEPVATEAPATEAPATEVPATPVPTVPAVKDGLVKEADGNTYYYVNGVKTYAGLIEIDGDIYYIRSNYRVATGSYAVSKHNGVLPAGTYEFGADGKLLRGLAESEDGLVRYYVNGVRTYAGLIEIDGDIYYIRSNYRPAVGSYTVSKHNGLRPYGTYTFDADGKLVEEPVATEAPATEVPATPVPTVPAVKNGLVKEADGYTYYYVDGVRTYAGLIEIDGDIYYIRSNGRMATGSYAVSKHNGVLPAAVYEFGADGKMLNGLAESEDGIVRYYVNGVRTYAGLIEIDGDIYYIRSNYRPAVGSYTVSKHNGLRPYGTYTFDADGKLVD